MNIMPMVERFYEIFKDLQSEMNKLKMKTDVSKVPLHGSVDSILGEMEEVQVYTLSATPSIVFWVRWKKYKYVHFLLHLA